MKGSVLRRLHFELRRVWRAVPLELAVLLFVAGFVCQSSAVSLQLVSSADPLQSAPAGGGGESWSPILSADGRFVLFASAANNLG